MPKFWISITFLIAIFIPNLIHVSHSADYQTWSDITTIKRFAEGWRYDGDQGVRWGELNDSDFTQLYVRPSVRYRARPWFTVHGGIRFFQTFIDDEENTFEIGPWQGLRLAWPEIGGYPVTHYLRLEERMIWQTGGESDSDFTLRSRYQLGLRSPNFDILFKNGIYLSATIEPFANIEKPLFINRIRYDVGLGTQISDAWRVQLRYLLQQGRVSASDTFSTDEHILRLRFFYTF
jgi:hypothetical protein